MWYNHIYYVQIYSLISYKYNNIIIVYVCVLYTVSIVKSSYFIQSLIILNLFSINNKNIINI